MSCGTELIRIMCHRLYIGATVVPIPIRVLFCISYGRLDVINDLGGKTHTLSPMTALSGGGSRGFLLFPEIVLRMLLLI